MTTIRENAKRIFQMLIKDPSYENTDYRSREKVVFDEAQKRAKQHERNNQALSLGSSESVNKLLKFLLKADEYVPLEPKYIQDASPEYINAEDRRVEFGNLYQELIDDPIRFLEMQLELDEIGLGYLQQNLTSEDIEKLTSGDGRFNPANFIEDITKAKGSQLQNEINLAELNMHIKSMGNIEPGTEEAVELQEMFAHRNGLEKHISGNIIDLETAKYKMKQELDNDYEGPKYIMGSNTSYGRGQFKENIALEDESMAPYYNQTADWTDDIDYEQPVEADEGLIHGIKFEEDTGGYASRTARNAEADATLQFALNFNTPGERLTASSVQKAGKILIPIDISTPLNPDRDERILEAINTLRTNFVKTINIAGNGIYYPDMPDQATLDNYVHNFLERTMNRLPEDQITSIRSGGQTGIDEAGAKAGARLGIPTTVLAPKGWMHRTSEGDISDQEAFISRFSPSSAETAPPRNFAPRSSMEEQAAARRADVEGLGAGFRTDEQKRALQRRLAQLGHEQVQATGEGLLPSVPRPSTEVLPTFSERQNKPPLRHPLAYVKQYAKDLENPIDLVGNIAEDNGVGATEYYQPHLDNLMKSDRALIQFMQGRDDGTALTDGETEVIFHGINQLKALTNFERDFQARRRAKASPQMLEKFLVDIHIFDRVYYGEGDVPSLWQELSEKILDKQPLTPDDIVRVAEFTQRNRINAAKNVTLSLQTIGLDASWKDYIPNSEGVYAALSPANPRNYRSRSQRARDILFGNEELGVIGILQESGGVMPAPDSELFAKMLRAADMNATAFRDFTLATGATTSSRTVGEGYVVSREIKKMLSSLSDEAIQMWQSRFMRNPEDYMTDKTQTDLIDDVHKDIIERVRFIPGRGAADPIEKKIKTFKKYTLEGVSDDKDESESVREMPDDFEGNQAEWNRSEYERIVGVLRQGETEDEGIVPPEDIEAASGSGYSIIEDEDDLDPIVDNLPDVPDIDATEADWAKYDLDLEAAQIVAPGRKRKVVWEENDNVVNIKEGYIGHTNDEFKDRLEEMANTLYNLKYEVRLPVYDKETGQQKLTKAGKLMTRKDIRRAVGDVYISGNLAAAYHGNEDSVVDSSTPIEIKVRIPSVNDDETTNAHQLAMNAINEVSLQMPALYSDHQVVVTPHVGDNAMSNTDEYQVLFFNDAIFTDMGDVGNAKIKKRLDPFGFKRASNQRVVSKETLDTRLPDLVRDGQFQYLSVNLKPTPEMARQLIARLPQFNEQYKKAEDGWKKRAMAVELDDHTMLGRGNPVLDESGKPNIIDNLVQFSHDKVDALQNLGHGVETDTSGHWDRYYYTPPQGGIRREVDKFVKNNIISAYYTELGRLKSDVDLAQAQTMEGRFMAEDSEEFRILQEAGHIPEQGSGFAPATDIIISPSTGKEVSRYRVLGYNDVLHAIRTQQDKDIHKIQTGYDPDTGEKVDLPFTHEYDEDGVSIGIPNIQKTIQIKDPGKKKTWLTIGHLLPDFKYWASANKGQITTPEAIKETYWNVFDNERYKFTTPDGEEAQRDSPRMGGWIETASKTKRRYQWSMQSGYNKDWSPHVPQQSNPAIVRIKGDKLTDIPHLETLAHPPDAREDAIRGVVGSGWNISSLGNILSDSQIYWQNALRQLSGSALQLFRLNYGLWRTTYSGGKDSKSLRASLSELLSIATRPEKSVLPFDAQSPKSDIPSIWDNIEEAYAEGAALTDEDTAVLYQYIMDVMDNRDRQEQNDPNIPQNPEVPVQSIPGVEDAIPLLSLANLNKLVDYVDVIRTRSNRTEPQNPWALLNSTLGVYDEHNPFWNIVKNYRKYADIVEYEQDKEDPEFDVPSSLFIKERPGPHQIFQAPQDLDFQDDFYRAYPKYRAMANALGFADDDTPVFNMLDAMHLIERDAEGNVTRIVPRAIRNMSERLIQWAGKAKVGTVLSFDDTGEVVLKDIKLVPISGQSDKTQGRLQGTPKALYDNPLFSVLKDDVLSNWQSITGISTDEDIRTEIQTFSTAATAYLNKLDRMATDDNAALGQQLLDISSSVNDIREINGLQRVELYSVKDIEKAFDMYVTNLRRLDTGFITIPPQAYNDPNWVAGYVKNVSNGFGEGGDVAQRSLTNTITIQMAREATRANPFLALPSMQLVYDATPERMGRGSLSQARYEYTYKKELGQAIGDEASRNEVLAQVEHWIKTIRDRATNEENPDFVHMENPVAEANNAINLMLNNFGKMYLKSHPDYLADALFSGLPQDWWEKPLAEMDEMRMADWSGDHTVSPSRRGILMNFQTPVEMWHDNVLFNPSDLLIPVEGAFVNTKVTTVPINKNKSILLNPNDEIAGTVDIADDGTATVRNNEGEYIMPTEGMTATSLINATDMPLTAGTLYMLTDDDGNLLVDVNDHEAGGTGTAETPREAYLEIVTPPLYEIAKAEGWEFNELQTVLNTINAERTEAGGRPLPLEKLNVSHLRERKGDIAARITALRDNREFEPVVPAAATSMNRLQEMTGQLKKHQKNLKDAFDRGGIPDLYNKLWAEEAGVDYPAGALLDGWLEVEKFLQDNGFLGDPENPSRLLTEIKGTGAQKGHQVLKLRGTSLIAALDGLLALARGGTSLDIESGKENNAMEFLRKMGVVNDANYDDVLQRRTTQREGMTPRDAITEQPEQPVGTEGPAPVTEDFSGEFDEGNPLAPPKMSMGAIKQLRDRGFNIPDLDPWGDEMYYATLDEDGNWVFNDNFLGLRESPILLDIFRNLMRTDNDGNTYPNYEFSPELLEEGGDGRVIHPQDQGWTRSRYQDRFNTTFRTKDMENFLDAVLESDNLEDLNDFFDEPFTLSVEDTTGGKQIIEGEEALEMLKNVRNSIPQEVDQAVEAAKATAPPEGTGDGRQPPSIVRPTAQGPEDADEINSLKARIAELEASRTTEPPAEEAVPSTEGPELPAEDAELPALREQLAIAETRAEEKRQKDLLAQQQDQTLPELGTELEDANERIYAIIGQQIQETPDPDALPIKILMKPSGDPFDEKVLKHYGLAGALTKEALDKLRSGDDEALAAIEFLRQEGLTPRQFKEEALLAFNYGENWQKDWGDITDRTVPGTPRNLLRSYEKLEERQLEFQYSDMNQARVKEAMKGEGPTKEKLIAEHNAAFNRRYGFSPESGTVNAMTAEELVTETAAHSKKAADTRHSQTFNAMREEANKLDEFVMPEIPHPDLLKQLARRLILHKQKYAATSDEKGKPLMSDETKNFINALWNQLGEVLNVEDPETLRNLQGEIEDLGYELDEDGNPPVQSVIDDEQITLDAKIKEERAFNEYLQTHWPTSIDSYPGNVIRGVSEDGTPVDMVLDAEGKQVGIQRTAEIPDITQHDFISPHFIGLSPETKELWDEYHRVLIAGRDRSHLNQYMEDEKFLKDNLIQGLQAFRAELTNQLSGVDTRQKAGAEKAQQDFDNPINIIRSFLRTGGVFRQDYWKPQAPALLDEDALQAIITKYNIPPSRATTLMEDANATAASIIESLQGNAMNDDMLNSIKTMSYGNIDDFLNSSAQELDDLVSGRMNAEQMSEVSRLKAMHLLHPLREALLEDLGGNTPENQAKINDWRVNWLGKTDKERRTRGIDPVTQMPINAEGELIPAPSSNLFFHPELRAWVNPDALARVFKGADPEKALYISNYAELRAWVDSDSPEAQVFIPVDENSPLFTQRDIIRLPNGSFIPGRDSTTVKNLEHGPFNTSDIVHDVITTSISQAKDNNPEHFEANGQPYSLTSLNIADNGSLVSEAPENLSESIVNHIAPPKFLEEGGAAAKFLAEIRGLSPDVQRRADFGQQLLMGTKDFLNTPFGLKSMGLGFIIPMSMTQRFNDKVEKILTQQHNQRQIESKRLWNQSEKLTPENERLQIVDPESGQKNSFTQEQVQLAFTQLQNDRTLQGLPPITQEAAETKFKEMFGENADQQTTSRVSTPSPLPGTPPTPPQTHLEAFMSHVAQFPSQAELYPPTPPETPTETV